MLYKTPSKQVVHKAAEAKSEFAGNKISDKIVKPKHAIDENPRNVEQILILQEKKKKC